MESTIIAAVAALAGVALGGLLSRDVEYRKWLRTAQYRAVSELLAAGEAARQGIYMRCRGADLRATRDEAMTDSARVITALEAVHVIFPPEVVRIADQYSAIINMTLQRQFDTPHVPVEPPAAYHETRAALTRAAGRLIAPTRPVKRRAVEQQDPAADRQ